MEIRCYNRYRCFVQHSQKLLYELLQALKSLRYLYRRSVAQTTHRKSAVFSKTRAHDILYALNYAVSGG